MTYHLHEVCHECHHEHSRNRRVDNANANADESSPDVFLGELIREAYIRTIDDFMFDIEFHFFVFLEHLESSTRACANPCQRFQCLFLFPMQQKPAL